MRSRRRFRSLNLSLSRKQSSRRLWRKRQPPHLNHLVPLLPFRRRLQRLPRWDRWWAEFSCRPSQVRDRGNLRKDDRVDRALRHNSNSGRGRLDFSSVQGGNSSNGPDNFRDGQGRLVFSNVPADSKEGDKVSASRGNVPVEEGELNFSSDHSRAGNNNVRGDQLLRPVRPNRRWGQMLRGLF